MLRDGDLGIPDHPRLVRELMDMEYLYRSEGTVIMEDKADMKTRLGYSPDVADALMLSTLSTPQLLYT